MPIFKNAGCIVTLSTVLLLSACGGGGESTATTDGGAKPNSAPSLTATPSQLTLESGQALPVTLSARDDDGAPVLSLSSVSANISAELAADGNTVTITARTVTANEKGSVVVVATENNPAKKQTTQQIAVDIFPKLTLFALVNGVRQQALTAEYAKPLTFSVVDEQNNEIPVSAAVSANPAILQVQHQASVITLNALKTGSTRVEISGTARSGLQYKKSIEVNTVGNQQPSLTLSANSLSVEETIEAKITPTITDPDGSALKTGVLSVASASSAIATAEVRGGEIIVTGVKSGSTTLTIRLVDGEYTVNSSVSIRVTPEVLPVVSLNQNVSIEMEEQQSIAVPIEIVGPRAANYVPSVAIESVDGKLSDLTYTVTGNKLNLSAAALNLTGNNESVSFNIIASATNGRHTIKSAAVRLQVLQRLNAAPILEVPNIFNKFLRIQNSGTTTLTLQVKDDMPSRVVIAQPEAYSNDSKAGTYTMAYDDSLRQLTLTLTGFEVGEKFAIKVSYQDVRRGGAVVLYFKTYEFSETDLAVISALNTAIAKVEAARAYQLVGKLYAEHLQNIGVLDAQAVDELYDQLKIDDTANTQFSTAEFFINYYLEQVYNNEFNTGSASVTNTMTSLQQYLTSTEELNRSSINKINELAAKSNGYFPSLPFESSLAEVTPTHYSKFYGKALYGSVENGQWQYAPAYRFLAAIDAKVKENTEKRLK